MGLPGVQVAENRRQSAAMKIGILGAGHIGSMLAGHFVRAGHEVAISNSRGPETLADLVTELGDNARAVAPDEAARFGDLVVVALPLKAYRDVPPDAVAGKVVIDTMNYYPQRDGQFPQLDSGAATSSELLQEHLQGAHVVKAFNSIRWDSLRDKAHTGPVEPRLGIPIAGDDEAAKQEVDDLLEEIGFDGVDAGSLGEGGRKFQVGAPLYGAELPSPELAQRLGA
jgi:8-hydroxy-5-deazaflavin:NADPH oxidoreductase